MYGRFLCVVDCLTLTPMADALAYVVHNRCISADTMHPGLLSNLRRLDTGACNIAVDLFMCVHSTLYQNASLHQCQYHSHIEKTWLAVQLRQGRSPLDVVQISLELWISIGVLLCAPLCPCHPMPATHLARQPNGILLSVYLSPHFCHCHACMHMLSHGRPLVTPFVPELFWLFL